MHKRLVINGHELVVDVNQVLDVWRQVVYAWRTHIVMSESAALLQGVLRGCLVLREILLAVWCIAGWTVRKDHSDPFSELAMNSSGPRYYLQVSCRGSELSSDLSRIWSLLYISLLHICLLHVRLHFAWGGMLGGVKHKVAIEI